MASILGKTWKIYDATEESPFKAGDEVEIAMDATVKCNGEEWPGTYDPDKDKVVVEPEPGEPIHWEFVGSETMNNQFTMYGMSWEKTVPDSLGSWVSDPQGTP